MKVGTRTARVPADPAREGADMEDKLLVKDLMVPLEEYATVSKDATIYEAVTSLLEAQARYNRDKYRHRAVLVLDENKKVVGKLSQFDLIRSLEPKYGEIGNFDRLSHWGLSVEFIRSMVSHHGLWRNTLEHMCQAAAAVTVERMMYSLHEEETVSADDPLEEAMHILVMGQHQSLLVTEGDKVVGILRLSDVFQKVCELISVCKLD